MSTPNFYCEHCGQRFTSVSALTASYCRRHPAGANKGRHKLYEGSEKSRYTCKYCGQFFSTIAALTASYCFRHPNGANKGRHAVAL